MNDFEDTLTHALSPVEPSAGFEDMVMSVIAKRNESKQVKGLFFSIFFRHSKIVALCGGIVICVFAFTGIRYQEYRKKQQVRTAYVQLQAAIDITSKEIEHIKTLLNKNEMVVQINTLIPYSGN
jgi:predicted negative regulator of RcsB-dependent stress response